jgi:hypothetical protein
MDIRIRSDRLISLIKQHASSSQEAWQVAKRLKSLLPLRFNDLKRKHSTGNIKGAKAERFALADKNYTDVLEEFVSINSEAHAARVSYETYKMLHSARQTLRLLRR